VPSIGVLTLYRADFAIESNLKRKYLVVPRRRDAVGTSKFDRADVPLGKVGEIPAQSRYGEKASSSALSPNAHPRAYRCSELRFLNSVFKS
jgi:hypothetical protein